MFVRLGNVIAVIALLFVLMSAGCRMERTGDRSQVATVPPPVSSDLYPPSVTTPAQSDPFAQPGVFSAPVDGGNSAVFTAPSTGGGAAGGTYMVQKGETLWSIAVRVYGDGQKWKDIAAANPNIDPNKVREGQTINLP